MIISRPILIGTVFLGMLLLASRVLFAQEVSSSASGQTAIIGQVAKLSGKSISIKGKNETSDVIIDSTTKAFTSKGPILFSGVKIGDLVAAIATSSSTASPGATLAKKIYVAEASPSATSKQVFSGIVTGINESVVTIVSEVGAEKKFYNITASASAVLDTLTLAQRIIVVGSIDTEGMVAARLIVPIATK